MTLRELLLVLTECLDRIDSKYFVTGSVAAMAYGEFRTTIDADVAIDLRFGEAADLLRVFRSLTIALSRSRCTQRWSIASSSRSFIRHRDSRLT